MTEVEQMIELATRIARDYAKIQEDLQAIKKLLDTPTYVMLDDFANKDVAASLLKKISGPLKPGGIIRLTSEELRLYRGLLTCPPRSR